jgi:hypothetical protein
MRTSPLKTRDARRRLPAEAGKPHLEHFRPGKPQPTHRDA